MASIRVGNFFYALFLRACSRQEKHIKRHGARGPFPPAHQDFCCLSSSGHLLAASRLTSSQRNLTTRHACLTASITIFEKKNTELCDVFPCGMLGHISGRFCMHWPNVVHIPTPTPYWRRNVLSAWCCALAPVHLGYGGLCDCSLPRSPRSLRTSLNLLTNMSTRICRVVQGPSRTGAVRFLDLKRTNLYALSHSM